MSLSLAWEGGMGGSMCVLRAAGEIGRCWLNSFGFLASHGAQAYRTHSDLLLRNKAINNG